MRVQPDLPNSPLTATVMASPGACLWACSAAKSPAPPAPRIRMSVERRFIDPGTQSRLHGHGGGASALGGGPDRVIEAAPVRIHRHQQRPEALDPELPQAFGIEIVEID